MRTSLLCTWANNISPVPPPPPFTPTQIVGLVLWLKPDGPPNNFAQFANGTPITLWSDASGTHNDCGWHAGLPGKPTISNPGLNGLPGVTFGAASGLLASNPGPAFPISIFVVIQGVGNSVAGMIGSKNAALFYPGGVDPNSFLDWFNNVGDDQTAAGSLTKSAANLVEMTNDGVTLPKFFLNGNALAITVGNFVGGSGLDAAPMVIGNYSDTGTDPLNGLMAELLLYNSVLSSANRILVENYLIAKWGL